MGLMKYTLMAISLAMVFSFGYLIGKAHRLTHCLSNSKSSGHVPNTISIVDKAPVAQPPPIQPCKSEPHEVQKSMVLDTCSAPIKNVDSNIFIYGNDISQSISSLAQFGSFTIVEAKRTAVNDIMFSTLHHPPAPSKHEFVVLDKPYQPSSVPGDISVKGNIYEDHCTSIVATKSGSRITHTNKCLAVVKVFEGQEPFNHVSHRIGGSPGLQKNLTNRYQDDHIDNFGFRDEAIYLYPLLENRDKLVESLKTVVVDANPSFKWKTKTNSFDETIVVMVANVGVIDLLINFVCSLRKAQPTLNHLLSTMLVFVTDVNMMSVVSKLGMVPFYCGESCGKVPTPTKAAANYGDMVFARLMWFKTVSVYLTLAAGFNVLFQDIDMVWMRDPIPYLEAFNKAYISSTDEPPSAHSYKFKYQDLERDPKTFFDMTFMDDGSRTPRFSPLFVNSGFYYMRYSANSIFFMEKMLKAAGEITQTHSHQATMTRHLTELYEVSTIKINVLNRSHFPSGSMFHHDKTYISKMMKGIINPYVFHMCWTASREEKVKYLKEMNVWYISEAVNLTAVLKDSSLLEYYDADKLCKL